MEYHETTEWVLIAVWAIGSLALSWFVRRGFFVYFASVALAVPAISYSTIGYGPLEMGGIFHTLAAGVYSLLFHCFFQRWRSRLQPTRIEEANSR